MASGDRAEAVKVVAEGVAKRLGYSGLKSLQEEVVVSFVQDMTFLQFFPLAMERVYATSACQKFFIYWTHHHYLPSS